MEKDKFLGKYDITGKGILVNRRSDGTWSPLDFDNQEMVVQTMQLVYRRAKFREGSWRSEVIEQHRYTIKRVAEGS